MASVPPGSLVLITGVNGHVAGCIALRLLDEGYKVRGTVRAISKAAYLQAHPRFSKYHDVLTVVEVPTIILPGAFDSALQDVDAVIHTASPVTTDAKVPDEQDIPSVEGTKVLLVGVKATPSVKRFLYLSTIGSAVMAVDPQDSGEMKFKTTITRDDWNVISIPASHEVNEATGLNIYIGSKQKAEQLALQFMVDHNPSFTLTMVLGAIILGPIYRDVQGPPRPDQSLGMLFNLIADPPRVKALSPIRDVVWVHATDVADLFLASLTSSKVANKRLLAVAGRMSWVDVAEILKTEYPEHELPPVRADAPPAMGYPASSEVEFDTGLEKELLGGGWRSLRDAVLTCAEDLVERETKGWDRSSNITPDI